MTEREKKLVEAIFVSYLDDNSLEVAIDFTISDMVKADIPPEEIRELLSPLILAYVFRDTVLELKEKN